MSEDAPQDLDGQLLPAQVGKPQAAGQQPGHIEVSDGSAAEQPAESGIAEVVEPESVRNDSEPTHLASIDHLGEEDSGQVDGDKAWDMAHAEDKVRDSAREARDEAKGWRMAEKDSGEWLYKEYEWLDNTADYLENVAVEHTAEWAGVLHDHPVSETYKAEHPGVGFEAEDLAALEEDNNMEWDVIEDLTDELKDTSNTYPLSQILSGEVGGQRGISLESTLKRGGKSYQERWNRLQSTPGTTVNDMANFYKAAVKAVIVKPMVARASITRSLLNDIKGGKASQ